MIVGQALVEIDSDLKCHRWDLRCFIIWFQALNWLLRMVTNAVCIHDLLWFFVSALSPQEEEVEPEGQEEGKDAQKNDVPVVPAVKEKKEQKKEQEVKVQVHSL